MSAKYRGRPSRFGFTLVEILLVIAVIAVLAAMLLPAVFGALQRAEDARVISELEQIGNALKEYKAKYGELPPSMNQNDPNRCRKLAAHIEKAFRNHRYFTGGLNLDRLKNTNPSSFSIPVIRGTTADPAATVNRDMRRLDAAEMYVLALGGLPYEQKGIKGLEGFSTDMSQPFQNGVIQSARTPSLFEFDNSRLTDVDGDGWWEYKPPTNSNVPYVYFRERDYTVKDNSGTVVQIAAWPIRPTNGDTFWPGGHSNLQSVAGLATPFARSLGPDNMPSSRADDWYGDGLQLIAAGSDGIFVTKTTGGTYLNNAAGATYVRFLPGGFARQIGQNMQAQSGDLLADEYSDTLTNFNTSRLGNLR